MKNILKIQGIIFLTFTLLIIHSCKKSDDNVITDSDGNIYTSLTIGTQIWMKENLKTTKFEDGTSIANVTDQAEWDGLTTPAYCWYNNDEAAFKVPYGALYNWYAVNTGNLCPSGWHVSTYEDWAALIIYLDGDSAAGCKIKEAGTTHWNNPNAGATNESGFTALPGGMRGNISFWNIGIFGGWWSYTGDPGGFDLCHYLTYDEVAVGILSYSESYGMSVRCVRDI